MLLKAGMRGVRRGGTGGGGGLGEGKAKTNPSKHLKKQKH